MWQWTDYHTIQREGNVLLLLSEKSGRFGINDYKLFGSFGTHSV
jgi:hypothetical protein